MNINNEPDPVNPVEESSILSMDDIRLNDEIELLSKSEISDSIIIENDEEIPECLSELIIPFAETPVGEDPRYCDDFVIIKTEIDKLTNNNYEEILTRSQNILKNVGKDLRIAGYFIQSAVYINGMQGLIDGIKLYRLLLDLFYAEIHPQKESAKLFAIEWINNNKIAIYAKRALEKSSDNELKTLRTEVELINRTINNLIAEKAPLLTSLNKLLTETKPKKELFLHPPINIESSENNEISISDKEIGVIDENKVFIKQHVSSVKEQSIISEIISDSDLLEYTRKICTHLLKEKRYKRALSICYASRWSEQVVPVNDNGKTRIPSPRTTVINELQNRVNNNEHGLLIDDCIKLFMESGNHLWLDLQKFLFDAACALENNELKEKINDSVKELINRLPGIENCSFDDGMPFAMPGTIKWIKENTRRQNSKSDNICVTIAADNDANEIEDLKIIAKELYKKTGIEAAMESISKYRPENEKQKYHIKLIIAELCQNNKPIFSVKLLEELYKQAVSDSLCIWEPELYIRTVVLLHNTLLNTIDSISEEQQEKYTLKISELASQMCRWNPIIASKVLE